jgi:hypothetical protein
LLTLRTPHWRTFDARRRHHQRTDKEEAADQLTMAFDEFGIAAHTAREMSVMTE